MNKTPRLSKSGIEYLDCQWGIFPGCHNWRNGICQVENCWAKSFAQRFKNIYPNSFEPTFYPEAIDPPKYLKKPSIIGAGWVGDVIGYGLAFREQIFETIRRCPQHRFLFLTKNPNQLKEWEIFPENCLIGVTITDRESANIAQRYMLKIADFNKTFVSIEPFLGHIPWELTLGYSWLVIGAQTNPAVYPKIEYVREIAEAADRVGIPIFLKDNLKPLLINEKGFANASPHLLNRNIKKGTWDLRQERLK